MSEAAAEIPLLEELDITLCPLSKESLEAVGRCCPLSQMKCNGEAADE